MRHFFGLMIGLLVATTLQAAPLKLWISSHQDKIYYEKMAGLYRQTVDAGFEAEIQAFGFREMPDKLGTAIKTGEGVPDIVQLDEIFFGMYLSDQIPFADLTERVQQSGLDRDLLRQRVDLFTYQDRIYGLPQSLSAVILYCRRDLMDQHQVTAADLRTWDVLRKTGVRLAGQKQRLMALDWSYFEILLRQRGGRLFSKDGTVFPDEELALDTLRFLADLQNQGIGQLPDRGSIFDPVFFSGDVAQQEVLCVVGADWYGLDLLQQFSPELKGQWRMLPLPVWQEGGRRSSTFAGQGLLIFKDSEKTEQAWNFIHFVMTNPDSNAERFLGGNSFTAYKPSWTDERLLGGHDYFGGQSMGKLLVELAPELPSVVMSPKRLMLLFMLREQLFQAVMLGKMTPEQALETAKSRL
jgi:arabinosaccharide transport system substrate-binding protein